MVALLGQIPIAALIMLATFFGLVILTIDFNDQLQCHATEINDVRRDRVFTTKLLALSTTIAHHLPHVLRKLVRLGSLIASKGNRLCIAPESSVHTAPPIHDCCGSAPHPQPFSPFQQDEHHSPCWNGEKGASLE